MSEREYRITTEVVGPDGDLLRLYTKGLSAPGPRYARLNVVEADENHEAVALVSFDEAVLLVNGLVEYFEMTEHDVVTLFPGISDAALRDLDNL